MLLLLLYILITCKISHSFTKIKTDINKFIFNDIKEKVTVDLPLRDKKIITKINGFYGLIGPNINMNSNIDNLYELFTGDGIIQGIFFNKGELTFVKHLVKTEKVLYEEKNGKIPTNFMLTILLLLLNKIKLFPNVMGMANTAILNFKNKNYALFERDYPYLININFREKKINTIKKVDMKHIEHFSGHSKVTNIGNIETIDYKIYNNFVNYYLLNNEFKVADKFDFKFKYIPIVHDFYSNNNYLFLVESPLMYKFSYIFKNKIPIRLNTSKETFIHIYDKNHKNTIKYVYNKGFYILHYAYIKDKKDTFEIYASQYDEFDFSNVNIKGNYRMIEINKKTQIVTIYKNETLEKYNLDFPVLFQDKVISRHFENRRVNGFVITKDLKLYKELFFENKHICGEHSIIYLDKIPYLLFFNIEERETSIYYSYISLVNLYNYKIIDIKLNNNLNLGFHSIFIENSLSN